MEETPKLELTGAFTESDDSEDARVFDSIRGVRPRDNTCLVRFLERPKKRGMIYLADSKLDFECDFAEILRKGPGGWEAGHVKEMDFEVGDVVLVRSQDRGVRPKSGLPARRYRGIPITLHDTELYLVDERDVLAVVERGTTTKETP